MGGAQYVSKLDYDKNKKTGGVGGEVREGGRGGSGLGGRGSNSHLNPLGTPHADRTICPAAEQPREPGEPLNREDTQPVRDCVPAQDLERYDQRVR